MTETNGEQSAIEPKPRWGTSLMSDDSVRVLSAESLFLGAMLCGAGYVIVLVLNAG